MGNLPATESHDDNLSNTDVNAKAETIPLVASLSIDLERHQAWRYVAKALSRQNIEIIERNLDKGYFYVLYDPQAKKINYQNYWDELIFLFSDDPSHEVQYRISLYPMAQQATEVGIQDIQGVTLVNNAASHLLKLIANGITQERSIEHADNDR